MNISEITKVLELLSGLSEGACEDVFIPFMGKYVLIRAHQMGVNVGYLHATDRDTIVLKNSRKLWRWKAKNSIALESVAKSGVQDGCRATHTVEFVTVRKNDICGMISVDDSVVKQIKDWEVSEQD